MGHGGHSRGQRGSALLSRRCSHQKGRTILPGSPCRSHSQAPPQLPSHHPRSLPGPPSPAVAAKDGALQWAASFGGAVGADAAYDVNFNPTTGEVLVGGAFSKNAVFGPDHAATASVNNVMQSQVGGWAGACVPVCTSLCVLGGRVHGVQRGCVGTWSPRQSDLLCSHICRGRWG